MSLKLNKLSLYVTFMRLTGKLDTGSDASWRTGSSWTVCRGQIVGREITESRESTRGDAEFI